MTTPKKSLKASMNGNRTILFLLGLNLALLMVYLMFNFKSTQAKPQQEEAPEISVVNDLPVFEIETPTLPKETPTLPAVEPPTVLEKIDEVLDNVDVIDTPTEDPVITIPTTNPGTTETPVVDVTVFDNIGQNTDEEREEPEVMTITRVKTMAIYPGCKTKGKSKKEMIQCFSNKLNKDISKFLDLEFPKEAEDKEVLKARLKFVIDTNGEIIDIFPVAGDKEYKPKAKRTLEQTAAWLKKKGKLITPAKDAKDNPVKLEFVTTIGIQNPN